MVQEEDERKDAMDLAYWMSLGMKDEGVGLASNVLRSSNLMMDGKTKEIRVVHTSRSQSRR